MNRITTTIKRKWLAEIVAGLKKVEYRENKPYWRYRLGGRDQWLRMVPFELRLINGMSKTAPEVTVLIDQVDIGPDGTTGPWVYRLHIKKVLAIKNWPTLGIIVTAAPETKTHRRIV